MDALAAVRRLSFAALRASDPETSSAELARELLATPGRAPGAPRAAGPGRQHRAAATPTGRSRDGTPVPGPEYVLEFDEASAVHAGEQDRPAVQRAGRGDAREVNQRLVQTFNVASALFVPLAFEGEVRPGGRAASPRRAARFEDDHVQLAYTLANQAIGRARACWRCAAG